MLVISMRLEGSGQLQVSRPWEIFLYCFNLIKVAAIVYPARTEWAAIQGMLAAHPAVILTIPADKKSEFYYTTKKLNPLKKQTIVNNFLRMNFSLEKNRKISFLKTS